MKRILEIRAAEGGDDAKLFVSDLARAYAKHFDRVGWKHQVVNTLDGSITIEVSGKDLTDLDYEAGGHRIQRVPPTERKGRVHTSTVVVTVLEEAKTTEVTFNDKDFRVEWYSGTGAGGQHRNKHQNSCRLTHTPSGLVATAQCRSRENSLDEAKAALLSRLNSLAEGDNAKARSETKRLQGGSGERGDKIRTYMFQHGRVNDHVLNKSCAVEQIMAGKFELIWPKKVKTKLEWSNSRLAQLVEQSTDNR